jgi:heme exporter protein B
VTVASDERRRTDRAPSHWLRGGELGPAADFAHVQFTDVCYDYGRRRVLARVSFTAAAGTITGILGPNGAGKSTLLAVASTRARPSFGTVRYGTVSALGANAALRARIGWLGHDPGFYPELTAAENLAFYAQLYGVRSVRTAVDEALVHSGLTARRDDFVGGFSRGMRQRLGLERVLLHGPRLVLLDEPFTGLDDASAAALVSRLAQLRAGGCIVLLSTHDLDLVSPLLDRAIVLRAGRVVDEFDLEESRLVADDDGGRQHGQTPDRERRANQAGADALLERYRRAIAPSHSKATDHGPSSAARVAAGRAADDASAAHGPLTAASDSVIAEIARFVSAAWLIVRKDLVVEFRSRELLLTTLFFAVACVLVFAFALVREGRPMADAAAGILWIAIAFAGTLALGRTFEREQAHQTLHALLQAPVDRAAVYTGKLLGLLVLLLLVEAVVVPLVALFFQAALVAMAVHVAGLVVVGTVGLLGVGTLFSAMLVRTRSRDVLLPVLLYPMTVPALIAGSRGTAALIQETPDWPAARAWLAMLVFFDAVFLTLALWTFDAVTSD